MRKPPLQRLATGELGHGFGEAAVILGRVILRRACPNPRWTAQQQIFVLFGGFTFALNVAHVVEHLQRDPEVVTEFIESAQTALRHSREESSQGQRKPHQRAGFELHGGKTNAGDLRLCERFDACADIQRLAEMRAQQHALASLVGAKFGGFGQAGSPDQLERPEIKSVTGIERGRQAIADVQSGRAAPHAAAVLNVVHDERAGVDQFGRSAE